MEGNKTVIVTAAVATATIMLTVFGLYAEQRRDFGAQLEIEREARRKSDRLFREDVHKNREEMINLLLEIAKDDERRRDALENRINQRFERYEERQMFLVKRFIEVHEMLMQLKHPNEEVNR